MKVFKFGGASVKDADGVRNLAEIVRTQGKKAVVVVSAMGKTTNALEELVRAYVNGQEDAVQRQLATIKANHNSIMDDLTGEFTPVHQTFIHLQNYLLQSPTGTYDEIYDQIVSLGEVISTQIIAAHLVQTGLSVHWLDARQLIRTDATFREGRVDWKSTSQQINEAVVETGVNITQGFIGQSADGRTTTLGREGSDYTAAILAFCLNANSVTIWKDVPGVLNADPKWFDETVLLEKLTYQDTIELAYYGATVIHPKTIKPLQNKGIPLYVRSFLKPDAPGTVIGNYERHLSIPSFIFKINQVLISLHPNDFSFIAEDNLSRIFGRFAQAGVRINLMQNTAISFSVVVDNNPDRVPSLLDLLKQDFRVSYNDGLELITIRYYDQGTIAGFKALYLFHVSLAISQINPFPMYYGYLNGTIAPADQLAVGVTDLGLLRGYGLFDYFLTYNGRPFQWDWYWERFQNSASRMHLPLPLGKDETYTIVMKLVEQHGESGGPGDVGIRFVLTGGYSADSISIERPNLLILTEPIHPMPTVQYEQGIKVILDEYVREMAEVKSTDYKRVILMAEAIRAARASDLLYQKGGEISELSRSNFFIVKGNRLITPDRHILHGITRKTVMQLAQSDFQVQERPVLLSELYDADEAFTTSSTKKVLPITQIGDLTIGDGHVGPKSKFLLERFDELVKAWS